MSLSSRPSFAYGPDHGVKHSLADILSSFSSKDLISTRHSKGRHPSQQPISHIIDDTNILDRNSRHPSNTLRKNILNKYGDEASARSSVDPSLKYHTSDSRRATGPYKNTTVSGDVHRKYYEDSGILEGANPILDPMKQDETNLESASLSKQYDKFPSNIVAAPIEKSQRLSKGPASDPTSTFLHNNFNKAENDDMLILSGSQKDAEKPTSQFDDRHYTEMHIENKISSPQSGNNTFPVNGLELNQTSQSEQTSQAIPPEQISYLPNTSVSQALQGNAQYPKADSSSTRQLRVTRYPARDFVHDGVRDQERNKVHYHAQAQESERFAERYQVQDLVYQSRRDPVYHQDQLDYETRGPISHQIRDQKSNLAYRSEQDRQHNQEQVEILRSGPSPLHLNSASLENSLEEKSMSNQGNSQLSDSRNMVQKPLLEQGHYLMPEQIKVRAQNRLHNSDRNMEHKVEYTQLQDSGLNPVRNADHGLSAVPESDSSFYSPDNAPHQFDVPVYADSAETDKQIARNINPVHSKPEDALNHEQKASGQIGLLLSANESRSTNRRSEMGQSQLISGLNRPAETLSVSPMLGNYSLGPSEHIAPVSSQNVVDQFQPNLMTYVAGEQSPTVYQSRQHGPNRTGQMLLNSHVNGEYVNPIGMPQAVPVDLPLHSSVDQPYQRLDAENVRLIADEPRVRYFNSNKASVGPITDHKHIRSSLTATQQPMQNDKYGISNSKSKHSGRKNTEHKSVSFNPADRFLSSTGAYRPAITGLLKKLDLSTNQVESEHKDGEDELDDDLSSETGTFGSRNSLIDQEGGQQSKLSLLKGVGTTCVMG